MALASVAIMVTGCGSSSPKLVSRLLTGIGNPVAIIMTKHNSLLVGDWTSGEIYEVRAR